MIVIQTAIWAIANTDPGFTFLALSPAQTVGSLNTSSSNSDVNSTGCWIRQAQLNYEALEGTGYYDKFHILTDVNFDNPACQNNASKQYTCTAQEFVYSSATPEPGTLVLLGTGFAAVLGRGRRKRKASGAPSIAV